jgi:hypothetical protein
MMNEPMRALTIFSNASSCSLIALLHPSVLGSSVRWNNVAPPSLIALSVIPAHAGTQEKLFTRQDEFQRMRERRGKSAA